MSRFSDDCDPPEYPNAGDLWWANVERALAGKRGQRDLRELEAALLDLPEKRLISGRLAHDGQVCTMAALIVHRRVAKGEDRDAVLDELERLYPTHCTCWHTAGDHENGTGECRRCAQRVAEAEAAGNYRWTPRLCHAFVEDEYVDGDEGLATAEAGVRVGMTFSLAWRLAYLNDEDFANATPEERYERVLAWVRERMQVAA